MKTKAEKIAQYAQNKKTAKVMKYIEDDVLEVQVAAYEALGEIGDQQSVEALQNAINDEEPEVRMSVAKAFQKVGNDHITAFLQHQMLHETDPDLKKEFAKAMDYVRSQRMGV